LNIKAHSAIRVGSSPIAGDSRKSVDPGEKTLKYDDTIFEISMALFLDRFLDE